MESIASEKLKKLINTLNSRTQWNSASVVGVVEEMRIDEKDIYLYQQYTHDPKLSYGRKQIYANELYQIYLMSWNPGDATAIHDHGKTGWGCVQFLGELEHREYLIETNCLKLKEKDTILKDVIVPIDKDLIHLMSNAEEERVCSLHIYGNNNECVEDKKASIYQPEFKRKVITSGTAYLNMDDNEVFSTGEMPDMSEEDYNDYLKLITPFYERIGKNI
ncbi:hypothetical protein C7377_1471 [Balneicella halophila]|uniref:Cysteine dioxygenase type I n=1 Tax=Balneicella halophila TaxID=1537566 RepID=A0A7L4UNG9_BALHA|nr:cysteine dioxygenase family protein [Balneicella halophila]PVX49837.1 hypothetical protein C7377_1471 [Balneicella halophila]